MLLLCCRTVCGSRIRGLHGKKFRAFLLGVFFVWVTLAAEFAGPLLLKKLRAFSFVGLLFVWDTLAAEFAGPLI